MKDLGKEELRDLRNWLCIADPTYQPHNQFYDAQFNNKCRKILLTLIEQSPEPGVDEEALAERLVNLSLSIAEQTGDTQRFLKAKRFIEDNLTRQPQKRTVLSEHELSSWVEAFKGDTDIVRIGCRIASLLKNFGVETEGVE